MEQLLIIIAIFSTLHSFAFQAPKSPLTGEITGTFMDKDLKE